MCVQCCQGHQRAAGDGYARHAQKLNLSSVRARSLLLDERAAATAASDRHSARRARVLRMVRVRCCGALKRAHRAQLSQLFLEVRAQRNTHNANRTDNGDFVEGGVLLGAQGCVIGDARASIGTLDRGRCAARARARSLCRLVPSVSLVPVFRLAILRHPNPRTR